MRRSCIVLTLFLILAASMPLSPISGDPQEDYLALTIYGNGLTKVNYDMEADPMAVQVFVDLFGEDVQNLIVRDENGDPLDYQLTYSTVIVDSIGATRLYFTYYTESFVKTEAGLTSVSINTHTSVSIRLPEGADFFDMSHIPIQISSVDGVSYLIFEPGDIYVYYLIGLPELNQESAASLSKAQAYILTKESEGYRLDGANELLSQATTEFNNREYYQSKSLADDALKVAVKTVESADDALQSINTIKISLSSVKNLASENYDEGIEMFNLAQAQFDQGEYVKTSLTLIDFSKIDLHDNSQSFIIVVQQFVPLILLLGLCSIVYVSEKTGIFRSLLTIRGGKVE